MAVKIEVKGLDAAVKRVSDELKRLENGLQAEMENWGTEVATVAKRLAPVDENHLRGSIEAKKLPLNVSVTVGVDYAAYLEFGTRKFAASYVAGLPSDWQAFAAQYKGKSTGGTFDEFVMRLVRWVHRKGITGTYSVKTQKRTGNAVNIANEDKSVAYMIALKILREGIKPHPYLYPAYKQETPKLLDRVKNILK